MRVNSANVIRILVDKYNYNPDVAGPSTNLKEYELAHHIIDLIDRYITSGYIKVETD